MAVCTAPATSWTDDCVRSYQQALLPFLVALALLLYRFSPPFLGSKWLNLLFEDFLPLSDAELLAQTERVNEEDTSETVSRKPPVLQKAFFTTLALLEALFWFAIAGYRYSKSLVIWSSPAYTRIFQNLPFDYDVITPAMNSISWLPAVVLPITHPISAVPFGLLTLYIVQFFSAMYRIGAVWYDVTSGENGRPAVDIVLMSLHLVAILALISGIMILPIHRPTNPSIDVAECPEDYAPLWERMTFEWYLPLIKKVFTKPLEEVDVWELPATSRARHLNEKFSTLRGKSNSLFRRIWMANSRDLIINFLLAIASTLLNFANPFFLNFILTTLSTFDVDPAARFKTYIYVFLMFVSALIKSEVEAYTFWFARRSSIRVRTEIQTAVFTKALVRKDFSGIVQAKEGGDGNSKDSSNKPGSGKKPDKGASLSLGADIGKIVNMMSDDASTIGLTFEVLHLLYAGPLVIIISVVFLYQLFGFSAFSGFLYILLSAPLARFFSARLFRLHKERVAALDRRMDLINEVITTAKLIKFYGWENRWIKRVMDSRQTELKWLNTLRMNQVAFIAVATSQPIFIAVISFMTYVLLGNSLTVPVAFTALSLFTLMRSPLAVLPQWIAQIQACRVSFQRIETFLSEDEVAAEVSSLHESHSSETNMSTTISQLGITDDASFIWNSVDEKSESPTSTSGAGKAAGVGSPSSDAINGSSTEPDPSDSVSVTSSTTQRRFELKDINIVFPEEKLTLVVGPTASGKTALLMALLGEMTMLPGRGKFYLPKHQHRPDAHGNIGVSYSAQTPFLQNLSIRDNILFGSPYEEERYEMVLDACALKPDLSIFEEGDLTEIGSRGISLSGGQKARVALARAIYARTKYVLLDDPLSAVDSHTAAILLEKVFQGPLCANRTVVLVTHHVDLALPAANYVVYMQDGRINTQGSVKDLREQGVLSAIVKKNQDQNHPPAEPSAESLKKASDADAAAATGDNDTKPTPPAPVENGSTKRPRQLVKEEARNVGRVSGRIYLTYIKASSYWTWIILLIALAVTQLVTLAEKLWIKQWGEAYPSTNTTTTGTLFEMSQQLIMTTPLSLTSSSTGGRFGKLTNTGLTFPNAEQHPLFYVGIYAAISFAGLFLSIISAMVQFGGALRASKILFEKLLEAVIRATMRWHDVTPAGRMLNRFSKDMNTVDTALANSLRMTNMSISMFFISVLTVVFFSPPFIVPAVVLSFVYYRIAVAYSNVARDLRRMESNTRSPIFASFQELLTGVATVRAFSAERNFLKDMYSKTDVTMKMSYYYFIANRWLSVHFDVLGGLAVLFTNVLAVQGSIGPGLAAVTITSALSFTRGIFETCWSWASLELDLNSMERVVEYLDLPQEAPLLIESNRPPAYWPSNTSPKNLVDVKDLVIRYAPELPAVLHGISFSLKAKERVGLLGRTGSGKSTVAMSLLRFTDPSSGTIEIDGIDITTIGVHDLRSHITFVAQDAVLFSGTIRENIDPFGDYTDQECLDVLSRVHLVQEDSLGAATPRSRTGTSSPREQEQEQEGTGALNLNSNSAQTSPNASPAVDAEDNDNTPISTGPGSASTTGTTSATLIGGSGGGGGTDTNSNQITITLSTQVSAGGSNFSHGQRQLLTLARALLRRTSIIILDEATSSIDYATDVKIQQTIREEFTDSLLLTIAHRLSTIIDYDRLMVLDNGRIVEFDTPYNLINRENGVFREMCHHSGQFAELEKAAEEAEAQRALRVGVSA